MFLLTAVLLLANEKEIATGRAINAELRKSAPTVEDAQLTAYVNKIADRFREQSPMPLTVEVTSNLKQRAVSALPGGFLRIPMGSILQSETEADLAFVIAHAVAHLAKRHHLTAATGPLVFLNIYKHGDEDLMPRAASPRYRQAEAEADALASQWTAAFEATGEFEAMRQRAQQLTATPARRTPTLRRASEQQR